MKAFQDVGKCMVMKQAGRQTDNKGLAATLQRLLVVTVVVAHIVDRPLLRLVGRWPSGAKYPLSQLRAQHVCKQLCSSAELPDILCVNCTPGILFAIDSLSHGSTSQCFHRAFCCIVCTVCF